MTANDGQSKKAPKSKDEPNNPKDKKPVRRETGQPGGGGGAARKPSKKSGDTK